MSYGSILFQYLDNEKQIVYLVGAIKFRTAAIGMHYMELITAAHI
jgi:hypothetical protein